MATDPFELFDQWFAEAREAEINDPEAMALATTDAAGQPSVRMVLLKGHGPGRLRLLHQRARAEGRTARRQPARVTAVPLEDTAPPGPRRRAGRARQRRRCRCLFRDPFPRFAARRLGVRPVAAARQPRDIRAALRGDARRSSRGGRAAPAALGRVSRDAPSASNSGRTDRTGFTSAGCSRGRTAAGAKGCSTRDDRRRPPPGIRRCRPVPRSPASPSRCCCSSPRAGRRGRPIPPRCSDRSPTPRSTSSPASTTLAGVRMAAVPADRDHRFGHGKAEALVALVQIGVDRRLRDRHRLARDRPADQRRPDRSDGRRNRRVAVRDRRDLRPDLVPARDHRPHRFGRDQDRQCALQVGPDAQRRGDRRAGARSGAECPRRGSAVRDRHCRCGWCGAAIAPLARPSTS